MHKLDTHINTAPRFNSEDAFVERAQQVTQNHISREYEDYTNNGNKIEKGRLQ